MHSATNKELRSTIATLTQSVNTMASQIAASHAHVVVAAPTAAKSSKPSKSNTTSARQPSVTNAAKVLTIDEQLTALAGSNGDFKGNEEAAFTLVLGLQDANSVR